MGAKQLRKFGNAHEDTLEKVLQTTIGREDLAAAIGYVTNNGDPTGALTPAFIGQRCLDTANNAWYMSHGVAAADWKKLTP